MTNMMQKYIAVLSIVMIITNAMLLSLSIHISHAAIVVNDMIAFFQSSCPSGWSDIDSSKRGYLLVVDPNGGTTAGTIVGSALSNQQNPQHNHAVTAGTFCINSSITLYDAIDTCISSCSYYSLKAADPYTICEDSAFNLGNSASGYPFVQLRLCKATSLASQVEVPANTVAYFDSSVKSCPTASGWSDYTAAHGRVLVPQTKNTAPQTSSSSALTSGQTLSHKHSISTTEDNVLQVVQDITPGSQGSIGNVKDSTTRTIDVEASNEIASDLGIGYVQLTACVASATSAPTYIAPPSGAMLFTSTSSCSSDGNWNPVEDAFLNRLVVSLPTDAEANNAATWGGSAIVPPNDATHTHSVPATTLDLSSSDWYYNSANSFAGGKQWRVPSSTPTPATISIPSFTSGSNKGGSIPYLALGLCRSLGPNTAQPTTKTPTSKSPTNVPTVLSTKIPTTAPSYTVTTSYPTLSPTKKPLSSPTTTASPTATNKPTTASPSKAPSETVTTTLTPTFPPILTNSSTFDQSQNTIIIGSVSIVGGILALGVVLFLCRKRIGMYEPLDDTKSRIIWRGSFGQRFSPNAQSQHSNTPIQPPKVTGWRASMRQVMQLQQPGSYHSQVSQASPTILTSAHSFHSNLSSNSQLLPHVQSQASLTSTSSSPSLINQSIVPSMINSNTPNYNQRPRGPPSMMMSNSPINYSQQQIQYVRPIDPTIEQRKRVSTFTSDMVNSNINSTFIHRLVTLFPFQGVTDVELSVPEGVELIEIGKEGDHGEWTVAMNPITSTIGLIPTSYVKMIR